MMNLFSDAYTSFYKTAASDQHRLHRIESAAGAASEEDNARRAQENLVRLVSRYTFLIGTCSLLHPQFSEMMGHLIPLLRENGKYLIIPDSVINDLQRLVIKNPEMTDQISNLIHQLANLRMEGLVQVCGNGTERSFAKHLIKLAEQLLTYTEPLIITQNNRLSEDLVALNRARPTTEKRLAVSRVNHYGFLSRYIPQTAAMQQPVGLNLADLSALTSDFQLGA